MLQELLGTTLFGAVSKNPFKRQTPRVKRSKMGKVQVVFPTVLFKKIVFTLFGLRLLRSKEHKMCRLLHLMHDCHGHLTIKNLWLKLTLITAADYP